MAVITAEMVADYFIRDAHESGQFISNLQLQKLVYYAQAWYLAIYDEPLFDERIEAWVHGPVIPILYHKFKDFKWNPIDCDIGEVKLPRKVVEHLDEVIEVYGGFAGWELERLVHSEGPWKKARKGLPPSALSSDEISHEDMKNFYGALLDEQEEEEEEED